MPEGVAILARLRVRGRSSFEECGKGDPGRRTRFVGTAVAERRRTRAGHRKGKRMPYGASTADVISFASSLVGFRCPALTSIETAGALSIDYG